MTPGRSDLSRTAKTLYLQGFGIFQFYPPLVELIPSAK